MQERLKNAAIELLNNGTVDRILGWKAGEFFYDLPPAVFTSPEEVEKDFVWGVFSGANLSKYLIAESRKGGKVAVFLKPCDSYSFVQLLKEHRILRENVHVIGVQCDGMCDMEKIRAKGADGAIAVKDKGETLEVETLYGTVTVAKRDALLERCTVCKSKKVVVFDEMIGENGEEADSDRFDLSDELELSGIRQLVASGAEEIPVTNKTKGFTAMMKLELTERQRKMILFGGLINMIAAEGK